MKMSEEIEKKEGIIKPLDQYNYEDVINMCSEFRKVYSLAVPDDIKIMKLSALLDAILAFAAACPLLPDELRYPENFFKKWEVQEGIVHPKGALYYVWKVREELIKQLVYRGRMRPGELRSKVVVK